MNRPLSTAVLPVSLPRAMLVSLLVWLLFSVTFGQAAFAQQSGADSPRAIFDAEICKIDGLTPAQCDCAWNFMSGKLSASDLKLAMLLNASNSENEETSKNAFKALDKSNASDKRRDALSSESSALVIEAEDACEQ